MEIVRIPEDTLGVENKGTVLEIIDKRANQDVVQAYLLSERIKKDLIVANLREVKRLMGDYASDVDPGDLEVDLMEGEFGSGTIKGKVVELCLPADSAVVESILPVVDVLFPETNINDKDTKAREVANAVLSSTVFHEGTHAMIDSKPGSKMSRDLEIDDPDGETGTMIDEGITYALQGIYAKENYLIPDVKQDDRIEVQVRKRLGERLRPKIKEFIDGGKAIDKEFLQICLKELEQVKIEKQQQ